ncbi:MAG: excinuclease ABC subunit UvrB [Clostridia bacterium]
MADEFKLISEYSPTGDQPKAIEGLVDGYLNGKKREVLLGVTGSGKTFTMANVIQKLQRPTLIIAHNKTLAAQLCSEFREFFPDSAVEYFVSYYDYYQPEAYIASSDTYIEKVSSINEEIDRLRHSATCALNERKDVIIVSSVSCIYALGNPEEYIRMSISIRKGTKIDRDVLMRRLVDIQYQRNDIDFSRGNFRARGDVLEVFPMNFKEKALRIEFFGDEIERISEIHLVTGKTLLELSHAIIFPATHYAVAHDKLTEVLSVIEKDLKIRLDELTRAHKLLEAQRLEQRTVFDMEMISEIGYCQGIENYSRYFDGRSPGQPPFTLMDYFPKNFLLMIDESHVTLPQIRGMFNGDAARKHELVEYGFRLPSAYDNRPLKFDEFDARINKLLCVSATPSEYELGQAECIVEQIIRPTGLIDPEIIVKPVIGQVDDLMEEIKKTTANGFRVLVTTLTKRMAEDLTEYLDRFEFRVRYMHSEIQTMERTEILRDLRLGEFDVLIGINLLREGLDLPEVGLVAILDADKEGFLRSSTSLIQIVGRAARNVNGRVVMYADHITNSMDIAINETNRRRKIQAEYNRANDITPTSIHKEIRNVLEISKKSNNNYNDTSSAERAQRIEILRDEMKKAAAELEFETAAKLRDELFDLTGERNVEKQYAAPGTVGSKRNARERTRKSH